MANWQYNATQDLREYSHLRESLYNIPDRIKTLEVEAVSIRSTTYDKTPVDGDISGWEHRVLDNIDLRERLKINLEVVQQKAERIQRGLDALDERERQVLERFYISRTNDYMDRLCNELGYEERNIYNIKNAALKKFTLGQYGLLDL